jgi:hypothetical protein
LGNVAGVNVAALAAAVPCSPVTSSGLGNGVVNVTGSGLGDGVVNVAGSCVAASVTGREKGC